MRSRKMLNSPMTRAAFSSAKPILVVQSLLMAALAGLIGCKSGRSQIDSEPRREMDAMEIHAWTWVSYTRPDGSLGFWDRFRVAVAEAFAGGGAFTSGRLTNPPSSSPVFCARTRTGMSAHLLKHRLACCIPGATRNLCQVSARTGFRGRIWIDSEGPRRFWRAKTFLMMRWWSKRGSRQRNWPGIESS